jgi:hypothetical protein
VNKDNKTDLPCKSEEIEPFNSEEQRDLVGDELLPKK